MKVYLLYKWEANEGIIYFGIFSTLKKACNAGNACDVTYSAPSIAAIEIDDVSKLEDWGTHSFNEVYDLKGKRII